MADMEDLEAGIAAEFDNSLTKYHLEQGAAVDPRLQQLQRATRIIRNLTNRVDTLTARGKQLEDRVDALEARLPSS